MTLKTGQLHQHYYRKELRTTIYAVMGITQQDY